LDYRKTNSVRRIGGGYKAVKFRFLLFLWMEPTFIYADPESNDMKGDRNIPHVPVTWKSGDPSAGEAFRNQRGLHG